MTWLPYVDIHFKIRELIGRRMEHGVTDQLDRELWTLVQRLRHIERAGWWN